MQSEISALFDRLKARPTLDSDSIGLYYQLIKDYDSYRRDVFLNMSDDLQDNASLFSTGRALSNLAGDIVDFEKRSAGNAVLNGSTGIVFLGYRGGVGNRLRSVVSLRTIAKKLSVPFFYTWTEALGCTGAPAPIDAGGCSCGLISMTCFFERKLLRKGGLIVEASPDSPWLFYGRYREVASLGRWEEFVQDYRKEAKELLNEFKVSLSLKTHHAELAARLRTPTYLALHLRRTDFINYYAEKYPNRKFPSIEDYVIATQEHGGLANFYLSTDDSYVVDRFVEEFGNRVVRVELEFNKDSIRQTSFKHAILDLLMLSESSELIGTPGSSFSEFAASAGKTRVIEPV
jgi:hypothetical protein